MQVKANIKPKQAPVQRSTRKPQNNDKCPCGSKLKYKHCHGLKERLKLQEMNTVHNNEPKSK